MRWWKTTLFLAVTLVSCVYLLPSIIPENRLPPFIRDHFKKKIQLGLDLQGGLHLVYGVDVNKAVADKALRIAGDLEDKLKRDKKVTGVRVIASGRTLTVSFTQPSDVAKLDRDLLAEYRAQLTETARDAVKGTVEYEIDAKYIDDIKDYAINQAIETIRGRVDAFGVTEPSIVRKADNIVIELPGLKESDFERIKTNIGRTAQLEFKIVDDSQAANDYMKSIAPLLPKESGIEAMPRSWSEKESGAEHTLIYLQGKSREAIAKFIGSLPPDKAIPPMNELGYEKVEGRPTEEGVPPPEAETAWRAYLLQRRAVVTGEHLTNADVGFDQQTNRPEVEVSFDREGASIMERVSGENVGREMAIILEETIESAPVIESRLGARIRITLGGYDPLVVQQEAKDLVGVLRTGALPAPLKKTLETKVGPTLGRDAVSKAKFAMGIGSLAVVLFMLLYYRKSGFIADVAMVLNILYMVAILAGFEATLTLPGIAGLVLTVGMAVDANIIIYERIREELRAGKSPRAAVDSGFNRAFWTVFDAHVTNFVAGIVLYSYGSGPVRGFAVTLLVGIVTNLFTSVWVSRGMFALLVDRKKPVTVLSI